MRSPKLEEMRWMLEELRVSLQSAGGALFFFQIQSEIESLLIDDRL